MEWSVFIVKYLVLYPPVSQVALKIIKHCQEEGVGTELVKGFLVGLVVGDTLEVTNSFPLPKAIITSKNQSSKGVTEPFFEFTKIF